MAYVLAGMLQSTPVKSEWHLQLPNLQLPRLEHPLGQSGLSHFLPFHNCKPSGGSINVVEITIRCCPHLPRPNKIYGKRIEYNEIFFCVPNQIAVTMSVVTFAIYTL